MRHRTYDAIVTAIRAKKLTEPFKVQDWKAACPGSAVGTYKTFLHKHAKGNPGGKTELFVRVAPGLFKCVRPFKYGF
jgi:hypothetical protein